MFKKIFQKLFCKHESLVAGDVIHCETTDYTAIICNNCGKCGYLIKAKNYEKVEYTIVWDKIK